MEMHGFAFCAHLNAPPSYLRALVNTTVFAGMFKPVEKVSVANSTCTATHRVHLLHQKTMGHCVCMCINTKPSAHDLMIKSQHHIVMIGTQLLWYCSVFIAVITLTSVVVRGTTLTGDNIATVKPVTGSHWVPPTVPTLSAPFLDTLHPYIMLCRPEARQRYE